MLPSAFIQVTTGLGTPEVRQCTMTSFPATTVVSLGSAFHFGGTESDTTLLKLLLNYILMKENIGLYFKCQNLQLITF